MDRKQVLESPQDLQGYFEQGCKPPEAWRTGIEYERVGVFSEDGRAIPYHGPQSLSALLERLVSMEGWRPEFDGPHIIALEKEGVRVTMEPGGQLELSGRIHQHLTSIREEVRQWTRLIETHSAPLGIRWLGIGLQPFTPLSEIGWVPKSRYSIMSNRLAKVGSLGHVMMKQTAGVQINLDYGSERDAAEKLRVAMGLTSLITALFANSSITEGRANGHMSFRAQVWQDTDPPRCGLLRFAFESNAVFQDYLDYALDVPMIFIVREGAYLDMKGLTFREYIGKGFGENRATRDDFDLHITTLFPEARLKRHLEIRGGDSGDPATALAQVAFWKGIIYDETSMRDAWSLVANLTWEQRQDFHRRAARLGTATQLGGREVLEVGADLYQLARSGLERQGEQVELLDPMRRILFEQRESPARSLRHKWENDWGGDRKRLIEYCGEIGL